MKLYRIAREKYANLEGLGGMLVPGRWHEKGHRVVYCSETRSLAMLEYLVHVKDYGVIPTQMVLLTVEIPDETEVITIDLSRLKQGWQVFLDISRKIGSEFLEANKSLLLKVPSALVPEENNFLINPLFPQISNCKITHIRPLELDDRFPGLG